MAISRLSAQDNKQTGTTASITVTYPSATTTGNLLIITVLNNAGVVASATGFTAYGSPIDGGISEVTILYGISTGQSTVAVTCTGATVIQAHGYEYTGAANPLVVDVRAKQNSSTTAQTSYSTAPITTTLAGDLIFSSIGAQTNMGGSESWVTSTELDTSTKIIDGEYIPGFVLTNWTDTVSGMSSTQVGIITIAFQPPAAATHYLSLLGVGS